MTDASIPEFCPPDWPEDWVVRPLPDIASENIPPEPGKVSPDGERVLEPHPYPPYTQCTHPATGDLRSRYLQSWRKAHYKDRIEKGIFNHLNCSHAARVILFGAPMCRRHAGMILLQIVESRYL